MSEEFDPYTILPEVMLVATLNKSNPLIMDRLVKYDSAFRELAAIVKLIENEALEKEILRASVNTDALRKKLERYSTNSMYK